jgi:hypothetical protein
MNTRNQLSLLALSATLAVVNLWPAAASAQTDATISAPATTTPEAKPAPSFKIPSRLDEIAQLSKAGVGDNVILAYIKDSQTAYNLNAQDIIKLRDDGVSPQVTAALIQRGTEVRQAAQEAAKESQTQSTEVAAAPTYQTQPVAEQPAVTYGAAPVVVRPASTVSVHYFGAPSYRYAPSYYYPRYGSSVSYGTYGSSYYHAPRASFSFGFGGHFGGHHSRARYCR